jgi:hypothetical protein
MNEQEDWCEENARNDDTWELLGKATPRKAGGRFADDTLRVVKMLPEADPWWPRSLNFSPWFALAACAAVAAFFFLNPSDNGINGFPPIVNVTDEAEQWVEIEVVADEEMLAAAADHLERFSDQELVTLIGF